MNWRRVLVAAGIVIFGASALELAQPGVVPLPASDVLLSGLGGIALLYAVVVLSTRRRETPVQVETPDVELATPPEIPGTDMERTLEGFPGTEDIYSGSVPTIRGDLRKAATAVLTRYEGLDPEDAERQVAEGTWTDDPYAADFLDESNTEPPLRDRLRALLARSSYQGLARARTADAVAAVASVGADGTASGEPTLPGIEETGTATRSAETATGDGGRSGLRQTHHWTGVSVVVLVCLGAGLLLEESGVLLAGIVAVGYAAYARATPQTAADLSVSRSLSNSDPDPGDDIEVTLTVTNNGGFCPDLRIVDGVPESLAVTDGSPRYGTALRAGESVTVSYTVRARQGTHEFGPVLVGARNLSGSTEQEIFLETDSTVTAVPTPRPVQESIPLRQQPTQYAGRAPTDSGGEGIEFHTVREYQPGDSMTRIDWNRRARTGELTTLEFRRERATRVVILIDTRSRSQVGHEPGTPDAIARSIDAAQRIFPALLANGHQVGIAAFGPQECFLPPDSGTSHRQRGRELLATDPAFHERTEPDPERRFWVAQLRKQLPDNTQLLLFSPVLDNRTGRVVQEFEAYGYPTTVVSPDPTTTETPSRRLMRARRRLMMTDLRQTGVPVLDWPPSESLEEVLKRQGAIR